MHSHLFSSLVRFMILAKVYERNLIMLNIILHCIGIVEVNLLVPVDSCGTENDD